MNRMLSRTDQGVPPEKLHGPLVGWNGCVYVKVIFGLLILSFFGSTRGNPSRRVAAAHLAYGQHGQDICAALQASPHLLHI